MSTRHITSLHLQNLDNSTALCLGDILNSKKNNKEYKNAENCKRDTCSQLKQESGVSPCLNSTGYVTVGDSNYLLLCTFLQMIAKVTEVSISKLQINFMESANNED